MMWPVPTPIRILRAATPGRLLLVALLLLSASGCASGPFGAPSHPELVAPGVLSTSAPEFAVAFSPDGRTAWFNRTSPRRDTIWMLSASRSGGGWSTPQRVMLGGNERDVDPFVSADGQRLYFTSFRPAPDGRNRSADTWYVERTAGGFGPPVNPGAPLNSDSADVFASVAGDGTIVFSSNRDGPSRVYLSRERGGRWDLPVPLAFGSVTTGSNPLISPDGRWIILALERPGSGLDLFVSCRRGVTWSEPIPLTPASSAAAEFAPALDPGGRWLYFTSERPGIVPVPPPGARPPGDLYRIPLSALPIPCR